MIVFMQYDTKLVLVVLSFLSRQKEGIDEVLLLEKRESSILEVI